MVIPLVVTYNSAFRKLSTVLQKDFNNLYSDAEVRKLDCKCQICLNPSRQLGNIRLIIISIVMTNV